MSPSKLSTPKLFMLFVFLLWGTVASAATQYISDQFLVPLRSSPCNSCKIVHQGLKSGLALQVFNTEDSWTEVQTPNGTRGWIPNQYLSAEPVARDLLDSYRAQAEALDDENTQLKKQKNTLIKENTTLKKQLLDLGSSNTSVNEELANIRNISADAVNLYEQNRELLTRNKVLQTDIDVLTATKEQLEKNQLQRWFIYGGFLVFLGALLSVLIPRLKPKGGGYSEWK
ncbi:MAG: TIGR04211 family SH3 domain-containing protein [Porticoccaceae bacterium]